MAPLAPSAPLAEARKVIRSKVAPLTDDRPLYLDVAKIRELMKEGAMVSAVETLTGPLYEP